MPPHDVIDKVNAGEYEIPDVSIQTAPPAATHMQTAHTDKDHKLNV